MKLDTDRAKADRLAVRAIGVGIGLLALMWSWLAGHRLAGLVWGPPAGPTVAFLSSIVIGAVVAVVAARELDA